MNDIADVIIIVIVAAIKRCFFFLRPILSVLVSRYVILVSHLRFYPEVVVLAKPRCIFVPLCACVHVHVYACLFPTKPLFSSFDMSTKFTPEASFVCVSNSLLNDWCCCHGLKKLD